MLLFFKKPKPDESLSSLLYRTAKENLMSNLSWILINFSNYAGCNIITNEVNWLKEQKLKKIADFLSLSYLEAKNLTFIPTLQKLNLDYKSIEKNPWFLYSRVRCCTICLREHLYHKKTWSSTHSLICSKHKVFLIDRCHNCNKNIDIKSIINNKCQSCNTSINGHIPIEVNTTSLIEYQEIIDNAIIGSAFNFQHEWIKDSSTFLKAIEFLGNWAVRILNPENFNEAGLPFTYDGMGSERNYLKNAKYLEQSMCIYNFAFGLIKNWPFEFYNFLNQAEEINNHPFKYFTYNVLPCLYGTELSFISKEFTNYIASKKLNLSQANEYIRTDQIKYINNKFNASVLNSKLLKLYKKQYLDNEISLVRLHEIKCCLKELENSLTKEELRARWLTSSRTTLSILKNNIIKDVYYYRSGSSKNWVIPNKSIEAFEAKLLFLSTPISVQGMSLKQAFEWIGPDNGFILLVGILKRKVKITLNNDQLSNSSVCRLDTFWYVKDILVKKSIKTGTISLRNLTFITGVKKSDIIHWIKTGRFGLFDRANSEEIPLENYLLFAKKYITTLEIALANSLSIKQVLKRHSLGKIPSVSGPQHNDGNRLLFVRKDYKNYIV